MTSIPVKTQILTPYLRSIGLSGFLRKMEIQDHDISSVHPEDVEACFHSVLVHSRDMTPMLEYLVGCRVGIDVLWRETYNDVVLRQVLLLADKGPKRPLVLGNIKIMLFNLPCNARALVQDEVIPFGAILRQEQILHSNSSAEFFRVRLSDCLCKYFQVHSGRTTYGRYRHLVDSNKTMLAQVIEIVSPQWPFDYHE